jgi:hypothetical protein
MKVLKHERNHQGRVAWAAKEFIITLGMMPNSRDVDINLAVLGTQEKNVLGQENEANEYYRGTCTRKGVVMFDIVKFK